MNDYLLKKVGEEGSEVAQAAFKVLLHHDKATLRLLVGEMADARAMIDLAYTRLSPAMQERFGADYKARMVREKAKGKA